MIGDSKAFFNSNYDRTCLSKDGEHTHCSARWHQKAATMSATPIPVLIMLITERATMLPNITKKN